MPLVYLEFYKIVVAAHSTAKQRLVATGAALEAAQADHNDALDQEARLARIEKDVATFPEVQAAFAVLPAIDPVKV